MGNEVGGPCVETIRRPAGRVRAPSVPAGRTTDRFGAFAVPTAYYSRAGGQDPRYVNARVVTALCLELV